MSRPLITVKTLLALAKERKEIDLPADALITPAAQDWLRSSRTVVRRTKAKPENVDEQPTIYLVGDAAAADLQVLQSHLEREAISLRFLPCNGNMSGLIAALQEACRGLGECTKRRAVVVVRDGAGVSCIANRYATVRAAILSRPSALYGLTHELGVNLLILERGRLSLAQMRSAIDTFLSSKLSIAPAMAAALAVESATPPAQPSGCPCAKPCVSRK